MMMIYLRVHVHEQRARKNTHKHERTPLVVSLGKALRGIPPSWCGRQIAGNS